MAMVARPAGFLLLLIAVSLGEEPPAGRAVYVGPELLKDYDPRPALVTKQTRVDRPRFPAIDVHCHWSEPVTAELLLKAMDELGVEKSINLSGGWGSELERNLARYHAKATDRLLVFANIDWAKIDEPDFTVTRVRELEEFHRRGVAGLKIFKSLGLGDRDSAGRLIAIDDPRLDAIFAKCGALKIPILIHAADPPPFFDPVDRLNERWMQLKRHPDWSFHGPDFPKRDDVLAQRDRRIARHPDTVFIVAHMAEHADDLKRLGDFLDAHPNAYVDLSAREAEIGRQPFTARRFFIDRADRILFGTDRYPGRPDQPRHRIYYRMLETDDEYFDYYEHPFPPTGEWKIYGLNLPEDVLRKVYRENARRALAGEKPLR
jgi:predicted TIM-barrel fold metal-dependent hydrolase